MDTLEHTADTRLQGYWPTLWGNTPVKEIVSDDDGV